MHRLKQTIRFGSLKHMMVMMFMAIMFYLVSSPGYTANMTFDHIATGFPLTGLHARVDCESCHIDGIFKGTPRACHSCHARGSRISATTPPEDTTHNLNQKVECDQCHRSAGWAVAHFEHLGISSGCNLCHVAGGGGRQAPNDQIHLQNMGTDCSECHRSTQSFTSAASLDHSGFTGGCAASGCHARDKARARSHGQLNDCQYCHKYPSWNVSNMNHDYIGGTQCRTCHVSGGIASTAAPADQLHASVRNQDCSDCHSTTTFAGATIDHSLIVSGCAATGCHAADRARAPNHAGLSSCESCHLYPNWSPVHTMNHSAIGTTLCRSCHTAGGLSSVAAPNDALHASIGSQDCSSCHSTSTFVGGQVDHTFITTGCGASGCHASNKATAPNHTYLNSCESCHHYPSWTSVNMNHNAVGTTMCRSCHVSGGLATTAAPNDTTHSAAYTGSKDCSACHTSTTTFTGAGVDHSTITTGCAAAGCHADDKVAAGSTHTALNSCESCHSFSRGWNNANMNHNAIGSTRCDKCHLYFSSAGLGRGSPNDSRHRSAQSKGDDCSRCHGTRGWGD